MKTAIYIEDGVFQAVMTPQDEFERELLKGLENESLNVKVFNGTFYGCQGGWDRQEIGWGGISETHENSLIITIKKPQPEPEDE